MQNVLPFLAAVVFSLYPCALRAQSTNASVTGRVTDPSKATVAEANVGALNLGTNFRYESTTNAAGEYTLANLPPGTYRIEVEKPGFKKLIQPGVALHVQDTLEINFEMSLGSATDVITVADVLPVETASTTVSTVVNQTFVENLPLNGRGFQTLIMMTPAVVVAATAFDDQSQFAMNAQRAAADDCVALAQCSGAAQQQIGTVSGTVSDVSGTGIPGALITASCGSFRQTVTTDSTGAFSLQLPPCRYLVRVTADEFAPTEREMVIAATDPTMEWNVTLTIAPVQSKRQQTQCCG